MIRKNALTDGLKILKVNGVTLEKVEEVISRQETIDGKNIQRIFPTKDEGVLIQLRPTDKDASSAFSQLMKIYGADVQELAI